MRGDYLPTAWTSRPFGDAYETVIRTIRERRHLDPTGRPAKSTSSIIEKLVRETIRLSQIQDIGGCRIVLANMTEQYRVVAALHAQSVKRPQLAIGLILATDTGRSTSSSRSPGS